jgi:hypothetical protein
MALEATLSNLCEALRSLRGSLDELVYTVTEDSPKTGSVILVDLIGEEVTELLGLTNESLEAAEAARRAASQPYDPNQMRRFLGVSQTQFQRLSQILIWRLFSYHQVSALIQLGHRRKGEWDGWVKSVRAGFEKCRPTFQDADVLYSQCWQEIAERIVAGPVSVHTTNIGQKITTEALESRSAERLGVT